MTSPVPRDKHYRRRRELLAENWLDLFGWLGSALLIVSLL